MSFFGSDSAGGGGGASLQDIANAFTQNAQVQTVTINGWTSQMAQAVVAESAPAPGTTILVSNTTGLPPANHYRVGGVPAGLVASLGNKLRVTLGGYEGGATAQTASNFFDASKHAQFGNSVFAKLSSVTPSITRSYDIESDNYTDWASDTSSSCYNFSLAQTADAVYQVGGSTVSGGIGAVLRKLDKAANSAWAAMATLPVSRALMRTCGLTSGKVLFGGGYNSGSTMNNTTAQRQFYLYNPATNQHESTIQEAPVRIGEGSACELTDGRVVFAPRNIWNDTGTVALDTPVIVNPATGQWQVLDSIAAIVPGMNTVGTVHPLPDGKFLFVNYTGTATAHGIIYDPSQPSGQQGAPIQFAVGVSFGVSYDRLCQTSVSTKGLSYNYGSAMRNPYCIFVGEPAIPTLTSFYVVRNGA